MSSYILYNFCCYYFTLVIVEFVLETQHCFCLFICFHYIHPSCVCVSKNFISFFFLYIFNAPKTFENNNNFVSNMRLLVGSIAQTKHFFVLFYLIFQSYKKNYENIQNKTGHRSFPII